MKVTQLPDVDNCLWQCYALLLKLAEEAEEDTSSDCSDREAANHLPKDSELSWSSKRPAKAEAKPTQITGEKGSPDFAKEAIYAAAYSE